MRDLAVQKRENDLVLGTFGRGFFVLDDYSPLREMNAQALTDAARLFSLRDAYLYSPVGQSPAGVAGLGSMSGNFTTPNPPFGAVFTYSVAQAPAADAKLVLTIVDENGRHVRRLDLDKTTGLRRIAWDLRGELPQRPSPTGPARQSSPETARAADAQGVTGAAGAAGQQGAQGASGQGGQGGGGGGFGGQPQRPLVAPGRYRAQIGTMTGDKVTPLGLEQSFTVVRIPQ